MLLCHWSKDVLKLHSSVYKPVLLHEGYEGKAVVPDINASSVWNQSFLGYQHNYSVYKKNDTLGYYCNLCNIFIQLQNQLYILYMYM